MLVFTRGSLARMARAAVLVCALLAPACSGNPYVIGRVDDAGAAPSDAAGEPDVSADECAGAHQNALFCSGFEADDLESEWSALEHTMAGQIARTTALTQQGNGALHASSTGPSSYALAAADLPALRSGELYLRAHVYVPAQLPTKIMNVLFIGNDSASDPFQGVDLNLHDGALQLFSPQSAERYTDTRAAPRGRWFCLRLQLSIDHAQGRARVFVDQRLALETAAFDTRPEGGVTQLRLGIDWSSEQASFFEVYFDGVVLDTQPLGCDV
jgi:hypothetical protein